MMQLADLMAVINQATNGNETSYHNLMTSLIRQGRL